MSKVTREIHGSYKKVASKFDFDHFTKVGDLYDTLSSTFEKWKNIYECDSVNFFENIRIMFTFSDQEEKGLLDLIKTRNGFSQEYKDRKIALELRKDNIYPSMNLKTWDIDQDNLEIPITELLNNKEVAWKHMLPKVSFNLTSRKPLTALI